MAGKRVPGVTTILGVLNKPALVKWANKLGLQGIDSTKYVDALANIGTLSHYLVECEWRGVEPDLSDYAPQDIDKAENALLSFWAWRDQHEVEPHLVEEPMVVEKAKDFPQLGRFAIRDMGQTVAAGMCIDVEKKEM